MAGKLGRLVLLLLIAAAVSAGATDAPAQFKGKKGKGSSGNDEPPGRQREDFERLGHIQVGLVPVYPDDADCPPISSAFGSRTRYDGSLRNNDHFGFHSGIDISAKGGTTLLAIAAGEVVHAGEGGQLVGNFVWLRHAPEDTGLSAYIFSRYQHLDRPTPHAVGTRLAVGDTVGTAGNTGTTGGHYGTLGYYHLHLLVVATDGPAHVHKGAMVIGPGFRFLDPLAVYLDPPAPLDNHAVRELPAERKRVSIAYQTPDGLRRPADTRLVWPLSCRPRR